MKLLISPMDKEEALEAIRGGADIIDIKNPEEGSLGASYPWIVDEIKRICKDIETSATLGDVKDSFGLVSLGAYALSNIGVDYIKVGFLVKDFDKAVKLARSVKKSIKFSKGKSKLILAGYGDYKEILSINPIELIDVAKTVGADGVMIDTYQKSGKNLLNFMKYDEISNFVKKAKENGLIVALAGSLGKNEILTLKNLKPDVFGVRGAVCIGGRLGRISSKLVRELKALI